MNQLSNKTQMYAGILSMIGVTAAVAFLTSNIQIFICALATYISQMFGLLVSRGEHFNFTTKYFDLFGAIGFVTSAVISFLMMEKTRVMDSLVTVCIIIWAVRLGGFLYYRMIIVQKDERLEKYTEDENSFIKLWMGQGTWVFLSTFSYLSASSVTGTKTNKVVLFVKFIGFLVWLSGFLIETVADLQKFQFKMLKKKEFITEGLWSLCRHPNYFGDILVWIGISILCFNITPIWLPLALLVSPTFVFCLLYYGTGVPIAEESYENRYGRLLTYVNYKEKTPILIPYIGAKGDYIKK